jgi:hypothetical protein
MSRRQHSGSRLPTETRSRPAATKRQADAMVPGGRDGGRPRLPACMLCVLDHLASGLPPGPRALLTLYGRHAHDAGCGIYPGLRSLSRELRASPVTLREWRDELQDRRLVERLPRKGPHGADLLRLGPCPACPQRDSMQSRCRACQRDSLQHAETEWWAAQRDSMQSRKGEKYRGNGRPGGRPPAPGPPRIGAVPARDDPALDAGWPPQLAASAW